jgi:DNA processing protein
MDLSEATWKPAPEADHSRSKAPTEADRRLHLALALCEGIGEMSFHRLLAVFGSPEAVFAAPEWELKEACPRLGAGALIDLRRGPDFAAVEAQEEGCRRLGFRLVTWREEGYPSPLLDLPCPPPLLFLRGEWRAEDRKALAMVGTRRPSPYGEKTTRTFGLRLAEAGWTVVSGLARGVDTLAHESALRGGGRTVAVLGSGLDRPIRPRMPTWPAASPKPAA